MKKPSRFLALLVIFCMVTAMLPGVCLTASAAIISVADQEDVRQAVAKASAGDIIEITGTGFVNDIASNSAPWIIDKEITIQGADSTATLNLRAGGIVLGANVTFENIQLSFTNPVRNEIMANGHTLTLTNVTRDTSAQEIHLFCGGVTGLGEMPASGTHGKIMIQDCTGLGNIYAGSISSDGIPNETTIPATVTINSGGPNQVGTLYGCGALQAPVDNGQMVNPGYRVESPFPSTGNFPMRGAVTFNLYHTSTYQVDGATGGSQNAAVFYTGSQNANDTLTLNNLSALTLVSGGMLTPKAGSSFDAGMALAVPDGTSLGLANLTDPQVGGFTGGGTLVLGKQQTLTITGSVTGTTKVAIGSISNGASKEVPEKDHPYIHVVQSSNGAFQLIPQANNLDDKLELNSNGDWTVPAGSSGGGDSKIVSLDPKDMRMNSGTAEVIMPLNSTYSGNGLNLDEIQLSIWVNNGEASHNQVPDYGSYYEAAGLHIFVGNRGDGDELQIYAASSLTDPIPDGIYSIEIVVPGAYTATGADLSASCTLIVGDASVSIPVPQAEPDLVWTGAEQVGVEEGTGYTLTGHKASDAGTYTATASLKDGYQWKDGTKEDENIPWSIAKSTVPPAAPGGLRGVAPTSADGADGKIAGTTAEMEYSADSGFSAPQDCGAGETAGLAAGTYYVRLKENSNHVAGAGAEVIVPAFGAAYVTKISIKTPAAKTSYQVGETLDVTGLTICAEYSSGTSQTVAVTADMVEGFDSSRAAERQTLTIRYEGQTVSYDIRITEPGTPEPGHRHDWSTAWSVSGTHHWHNCVKVDCPIQQDSEKSGYAAHTAGDWITDQAATATQSGSRYRLCSVCGYEMARETIPATGGGSSSGGGGSSDDSSSDDSSSDRGTSTSTVRNPDGSTTTKTVNKITGAVTEVTKKADGSTVTVETRKDGTVTTTEKAADGSTVRTSKAPDGSGQTEVKLSNGTTASVFTDRRGATEAQVSLSGEAVRAARRDNKALSLPIPAISTARVSPVVEITLPDSSGAVGVEIPVENAAPGVVAVVVNADGTETVMKKSFAAEGGVRLTLNGSAVVKLADRATGFSDVSSSSWSRDAIDFVSARGIFSGTGNGAFSPDSAVTRGMLAVALHSLENNPDYTQGSSFTDVGDTWYTHAVHWVAEQGIISGYGDGQYGPEDNITREQLAVMLWRYAGSPAATERELRFADADKASSYALEALRWAEENGIISGSGSGQLMPQGPATRAQTAQMLMNFIQKQQ